MSVGRVIVSAHLCFTLYMFLIINYVIPVREDEGGSILSCALTNLLLLMMG